MSRNDSHFLILLVLFMTLDTCSIECHTHHIDNNIDKLVELLGNASKTNKENK